MQRIFTSESVGQGHPDKLADSIGAAYLTECLRQDNHSRVGGEVVLFQNTALLVGEATTSARFDWDRLVRQTVSEVGYCNETGFDPRGIQIFNNIVKQSPDISRGVDTGGAGDQGIMMGYACRETPTLMPAPIYFAHQLALQLREVRSQHIKAIFPDCKTQVSVSYVKGEVHGIEAVVVSTHHARNLTLPYLRTLLTENVIIPVFEERGLDCTKTAIYINPTGLFTIGGPIADAGLTGRKISVDTYGGYARHGGGNFHFKDPTKVDVSGLLMARYLAKNIIANQMADRVEVQLAYAIGVADPIAVFFETFSTSHVSDKSILSYITSHNLTPRGIIEFFDLTTFDYRKVSAYGVIGREDVDAPWERIVIV